MELTNEFTIDRPVDDTWRILNDLEFIAPCMPGAQLQEIEGDEYRGIVKIKVGPITAKYAGKASFVEQNEAEKVARLKAEGRDPRQGNANAMITASMHSLSDTSTSVKIHTDLALSGKIASFGRGAIEDVSKKLLGQFADNLRDKLEGDGATSDDAGAPAAAEAEAPAVESVVADTTATDAAPATEAAAAAAPAAEPVAPAATPASTVRKIEAPEPEAIDILAVGTPSTVKKVVPVIGVAILLVLLRILLNRKN